MPPLCSPFRQRWPWIGPDLQTLRDTLRPPRLGPDTATALQVPVGDGELLVLCDPPLGAAAGAGIGGLVVLVHGLGGSAGGGGLRRLGLCLQAAGFDVWRLNLRGAGPGRPLAAGTYAAACNADLLPVLAEARRQAGGLPLLGVGLS
ncbi:MAG: alpha/beta hydrolase, partial [Prochlorococcaceae cyanobacterium]